MFESFELPAPGVIAELDTCGLIDVMGGALRLERAAAARRLFAIGELFVRRDTEQDDEDRDNWRIDGWDVVAAEVACAQGITRHKAAAQIQLATTLREELPMIAEVFAAGLVDYWVVSLIASRLLLVDTTDLARIDAALARQVHRWNRMSKKKIIAQVQMCDVDHTVAWPAGPTHPSNLKLLCRQHHLIKTHDRHRHSGRACESAEGIPIGRPSFSPRQRPAVVPADVL